MNKKFAAVGITAILALILTNCTGSFPAKAEQLNIITVTNPQTIVFDFVKAKTIDNHKTFLEKEYVKFVKANKNTKKMERVLKYLKTRTHKTPYVFSGSSPKWGWDCSGLVRWTYEQLGITLQHSATKQAHTGKRISYKNAKPGDIVVFSWGSNYWFYHAAIYLGNGKIINANRGFETTIIQPLSDFKSSKIKFVRIVATN